MQRLWHQAAVDQISAVSLSLTRKGGDTPAPPVPVTMWELRDRLPTDVLRELGIDPGPEKTASQPASPLDGAAPGAAPAAASMTASVPISRVVAGEVSTMTDVGFGDDRCGRALEGRGRPPRRPAERLAVRHQRRLRDARRRAGRGRDDRQRRGPRARRRAVARRQAPSLDAPQHALLRRQPGEPPVARRHWSRGNEEGRVESVGARYIEEANLYRATALGTTLFPLASRTWEVNARYGRAGQRQRRACRSAMTYRHREASVGPSGVGVGGRVLPVGAGRGPRGRRRRVKLTERMQLEGGVVAPLHGHRHGLRHRSGGDGALRLRPGDALRARPLPRPRVHGQPDGDAPRRLDRGQPRAGGDAVLRHRPRRTARDAIPSRSSKPPSSAWASSCAPSSRATS